MEVVRTSRRKTMAKAFLFFFREIVVLIAVAIIIVKVIIIVLVIGEKSCTLVQVLARRLQIGLLAFSWGLQRVSMNGCSGDILLLLPL